MVDLKMLKGNPFDCDEDKLKPWELKLKKFAGWVLIAVDRVSKRLERIGRWFEFDIIYDMSEMGPKKAFRFFLRRWWRKLSLRGFRTSLRMGWDYFKLGYKSYDYDAHAALREFIWKLKRIADHIEEHDIHIHAKQDVRRMRKTIELLERVIADDYHEEMEVQVAEKYGDAIHYLAERDCWNEDKAPFKNRHVGEISLFKREKWTPENHYEILKAERAKFRKAEAKKMREFKRALDMIHKYLFTWWD